MNHNISRTLHPTSPIEYQIAKLFGMNYHLENISLGLNMELDDARIILIYGIGGTGKTTNMKIKFLGDSNVIASLKILEGQDYLFYKINFLRNIMVEDHQVTHVIQKNLESYCFL